MARACSSGAKTRLTTARVVVNSSAPPTPVPARAAIGWAVESASLAISDPAPNNVRPATSIFRRSSGRRRCPR
jgi:hypothetical protein